MARQIYLDYAAATPLDEQVLAAMMPYFADKFYNPSANYLAAKAVRREVEAARGRVAHWLGAKPSEVIFTAGGTEANNLAIHGVMAANPGANIVASAAEHDSILAPAAEYDCRLAKINSDGRSDLDDLASKIDHKTALVSIMYANSEIGTIQPLKEIAKIIAQKRTDTRRKFALYFHSDACQAGNYLDLHVSRLGVDLMTLNGGKIYGPKQSGALFVKAGVKLKPQISGGGQERGLRGGTENVAAIVGFSEALDLAQAQRKAESERLGKLQVEFLQMLTKKVPRAKLNGSQKWRLVNNINLLFPEEDNERLLILLEEAGIVAAAGSACSASDEMPSHVLKALGLNDAEARASLRFSMGRTTTSADIDMLVNTLAKLLKP